MSIQLLRFDDALVPEVEPALELSVTTLLGEKRIGAGSHDADALTSSLVGTSFRADVGGIVGAPPGIPEYPGPTSPNYSDLHTRAQELFKEADKSYYSKTSGKHLSIESGTRTVYKQADLYIGWRLGQPGYNPANIPGASIHNYGLAIDVQNARDETVIAALSENGWTRTVMPAEPWHWEPSGTAEHKAALKKQEEMKAAGGVARKWQDEWETAKGKNDRRNKLTDDFDRRAKVWEPLWAQLRADVDLFDRDVDTHNQRVERWKRDVDRLNARIQRHNAEVTALQQLRQRIESMSPGSARNQAIQEYNRRGQAALTERAAIDEDRQGLEARESQLMDERKSLTQRQQGLTARFASLDAERQALLDIKSRVEQLKTEIEQHMKVTKTLLDKIAEEVHPTT